MCRSSSKGDEQYPDAPWLQANTVALTSLQAAVEKSTARGQLTQLDALSFHQALSKIVGDKGATPLSPAELQKRRFFTLGEGGGVRPPAPQPARCQWSGAFVCFVAYNLLESLIDVMGIQLVS